MSFKEKQSAITLLALWIVAAAFGVQLFRSVPATMSEATGQLVAAVVALVAVMIVSHIALIIGVGREEARFGADERDRSIGLASRRNAQWVTAAGLFAVVALAIWSASPAQLAEVAAATLWLSEMTVHGSRLYFYRRGL